MTKQIDVVEKYVLENWGQCLEITSYVKKLRDRQFEVLDGVLRDIRTQPWWGKDWLCKAETEHLKIYKKEWKERETGLYIDRLSVDNIFLDSEAPPRAYFWTKDPIVLGKNTDLFVKDATKALGKVAVVKEKSPNYIFCFSLGESRGELRNALINGDITTFNGVITSAAELIARLVPLVDSALKK